MLKARMVSEDKNIYGPSLPNASKNQTSTFSIPLKITKLLVECSHSYLFAVHVWLKIEVSLKELQRMREWTLGDL